MCRPFGWISFLLDLGEVAFGLVVQAMSACRRLAVAFDLLLPAHVACLEIGVSIGPEDEACLCKGYLCDPPPLGFSTAIVGTCAGRIVVEEGTGQSR